MIRYGTRNTSTRGDSPRIRGDDPQSELAAAESQRILPVFAGMIPLVSNMLTSFNHSPRIRGDDPSRQKLIMH